ncbi:hypothetical protein FOZ62_030208, partial [Perkinsus olseni]
MSSLDEILAYTLGSILVLVVVLAFIYSYKKGVAHFKAKEEFEQWAQSNTKCLKLTALTSEFRGRSCAICLDQFQVGDLLRQLPCGHCLHEKCFLECFERCSDDGSERHMHKCPLCREIMNYFPPPSPFPNAGRALYSRPQAAAGAPPQHQQHQQQPQGSGEIDRRQILPQPGCLFVGAAAIPVSPMLSACTAVTRQVSCVSPTARIDDLPILTYPNRHHQTMADSVLPE